MGLAQERPGPETFNDSTTNHQKDLANMHPKNLFTTTMILALATTAVKADLIYDDGGGHSVNSTVNDVVGVGDSVTGESTTVTFESPANITGTDVFDDTVYVFDSSEVFIEGGSFINDVSAYDFSSLAISGGNFGDDIFAAGESLVMISGGTVADDVEAVDFSYVMITGGTFGEDIEADGGTIEIFGGTFAANGTAFLDTGFGISNGGAIILHGSNFTVDGIAMGTGEVTQTSGLVSGTLLDGTSFTDIQFSRDFAGGLGSFGIVSVPEPASLGMLCMLFIPAVARRRRRAKG